MSDPTLPPPPSPSSGQDGFVAGPVGEDEEGGRRRVVVIAVAVAVVVAVAVGLVVFLLLSGDDDDGGGDAGEVAVTEEALERPADAIEFTDPEGLYRIGISPDWQDQDELEPAGVTGVEFFLLGSSTDAFSDNVNIVTEEAPGDVSFDEYLEASRRGLETVISDVRVQDPERITLTGGGEGAVLRYEGSMGGVDLSFFVVIAYEDGTAALATLTAPPERFQERVDAAEPYLRTLDVTPDGG